MSAAQNSAEQYRTLFRNNEIDKLFAALENDGRIKADATLRGKLDVHFNRWQNNERSFMEGHLAQDSYRSERNRQLSGLQLFINSLNHEAKPTPIEEKTTSGWSSVKLFALIALSLVLAIATYYLISSGLDGPTEPKMDDTELTPAEANPKSNDGNTITEEPAEEELAVSPQQNNDQPRQSSFFSATSTSALGVVVWLKGNSSNTQTLLLCQSLKSAGPITETSSPKANFYSEGMKLLKAARLNEAQKEAFPGRLLLVRQTKAEEVNRPSIRNKLRRESEANKRDFRATFDYRLIDRSNLAGEFRDRKIIKITTTATASVEAIDRELMEAFAHQIAGEL